MAGYEIKTTADKGRGLYTTKFFKKDDVIFDETPIVSCQLSWNAAYKYLACEYCLRPLETAEENVQRLSSDKSIILPYPQFCPTLPIKNLHTTCQNCGIKYCSEDCRYQAYEKYHQTLCLEKYIDNLEHPLNKLNETWKLMHYPPENCSIMLVAKILAMIKQSKNPDEILSKFNEFQSITFNPDQKILHKLLGDNFANDLEKLYQLTCSAFKTEEYSKLLTPEGFKRLFALLGTNNQGIGTSSFSEWERKVTHSIDNNSDEFHAIDTFINDLYNKMDEVSGVFLNNEGSGLYLLQSKINHSCLPNAEVTFPYSNNILSVKILNDIKPGEEICISYLDECFLDRSRHSRQKELKENYLFICNCPLCMEQINEPNLTSEDEDDDDEEEEPMED